TASCFRVFCFRDPCPLTWGGSKVKQALRVGTHTYHEVASPLLLSSMRPIYEFPDDAALTGDSCSPENPCPEPYPLLDYLPTDSNIPHPNHGVSFLALLRPPLLSKIAADPGGIKEPYPRLPLDIPGDAAPGGRVPRLPHPAPG